MNVDAVLLKAAENRKSGWTEAGEWCSHQKKNPKNPQCIKMWALSMCEKQQNNKASLTVHSLASKSQLISANLSQVFTSNASIKLSLLRSSESPSSPSELLSSGCTVCCSYLHSDGTGDWVYQPLENSNAALLQEALESGSWPFLCVTLDFFFPPSILNVSIQAARNVLKHSTTGLDPMR